MSLWPLYMVWKIPAILCACHRDMKAGQEEEEEEKYLYGIFVEFLYYKVLIYFLCGLFGGNSLLI